MQINEGPAPNTFWRVSLSNSYRFQLAVAARSASRGMVVVLRDFAYQGGKQVKRYNRPYSATGKILSRGAGKSLNLRAPRSGGVGTKPSRGRHMQRHGPDDEPVEIALAPLLGELDGKSGLEKPDDAAGAGAYGQRRSNWRLQFSRDRGAADRHVDDQAFVDGAVGQGQGRMRIFRNDAGTLLPQFRNGGILQLLFQPGKLVGEPFTRGLTHIEFDQKGAGRGVDDAAIELAEIAEIGCQMVADLADDRHVNHHLVRGNATGAAAAGAELAIGVIPIGQRVLPSHRDGDRALLERQFS